MGGGWCRKETVLLVNLFLQNGLKVRLITFSELLSFCDK